MFNIFLKVEPFFFFSPITDNAPLFKKYCLKWNGKLLNSIFIFMDFIISWYHHSYRVTKTTEFQIMNTELLFFLFVCFLQFSKHVSEKAMATHSSTLAWKIPWTEEPGGLQSMGSLGVGHDWATSLSLFTFMNWRRKLQPTPVFLPGESQGQGSLVGCRLPSMGLHRVGHDWHDLAAANMSQWASQVALVVQNLPASTGDIRDDGSIPGSGRSLWRRDGYPLQYSWASLLAQLVKNPPAMQETWVRSLGWEDPPKEEMATHSSIFAWKIPWTETPGGLQSMRPQKVRHNWASKPNMF